MKRLLSLKSLIEENAAFLGSGGRSQENANLGFAPAFYDFATNTIHRSCFADGTPAPFHVLDGLPAKATLISGFVRAGFFYTRSAAARAVREWTGEPN